MSKAREYEIEPEPECTNPNHGYFIRHGVPCTCAIQPGTPPRIRTYHSDALGTVTIPGDEREYDSAEVEEDINESEFYNPAPPMLDPTSAESQCASMRARRAGDGMFLPFEGPDIR